MINRFKFELQRSVKGFISKAQLQSMTNRKPERTEREKSQKTITKSLLPQSSLKFSFS